jgi:hypothetical protein
MMLNIAVHALPKTPKMIIKSIKNNTPFSLLLIDRFNNDKSLTILNNQTIEANFEIIGSKNIIINGSLSEILAKEAQFIIKKIDQNNVIVPDQEAYLNINLFLGGIDDGSGVICGTLGSTTFKFTMAGKKGGCTMSSSMVKNSSCDSIEISIEFYTNPKDIQNDVFKIYGNCNLNEK